MSRPAPASLPHPALARASSVALSAGVLLLALGAGMLGGPHPAYAVALVAVPYVVLGVLWPPAALIPAVALLVFTNDVAGGRLGGLQVAASDLLFAVGLAGLAVLARIRPPSTVESAPADPDDGDGRRPGRRGGALGSMAALCAVYLVAYVVAFGAHPSMAGLSSLAQRAELVGLALLAGHYLARTGR